jgi:OmcA/MtrC family decaheme c-type cytochrome
MSFITSGRLTRIFLAFALLIGAIGLQSGSTSPYNKHQKAFYAAQSVIDFARPGLVITINSAKIASDGTITATYTLTDPAGLPLDASGVTTPGAVSLAYIASYIPTGQAQYVAYTTATVSGKALGTITRPDFELGNPPVSLGNGQYTYTFSAKAPAGFDAAATTTVAIDGNRDLTAFNLGTSYAGTTFNFVPNGAAVTVTRDVIKTSSCNTCHDQLAFHGGYAHGMEMCVLCHQPQNADPTTGNSLDLKVMAHKIHMGSSLPSVVGTTTTKGVPYQIAGYMNFITDFSTVVDPSQAQRCEVCHSQTTGAAQATAYMTTPSRVACGSCHDDVNFATGANHAGGFQQDDTQCHNCHVPQGELPFDASIKGAHVVASDTAASYPQNPDTLITSINVVITGVSNHSAGEKPVVAYTVKDIKGNPIALNDPTLEDMQFTMAGPTTDYGYTSFGSDVTTPGYVGEDGTQGTCDKSGNCTYTFLHAIPAKATGTFAIGVESERLENILTGTNSAQQVESGTPNSIFYFSVDGSPVQPRRTVVAETNCNQCHTHLTLHGNRRNNPEYCVMCHNPSDTDFSQRKAGDTPQTINMAVMVHRIHDGVNVVPAGGKPFIVIGHGGNPSNFSGVLYPAMSPAGDATYLQNCSMCHTNGSEQNLPIGLNAVVDPQGWINPVQATASACSGCHVSKGEAAHFLANTDSLGESCATCHAAGAQFAVDAVHAQ